MSIYKEYRREPSIPHQCMHHSHKHGERCRGRAMHNEVMCFQHRIEDLPTVLQNDPFELTSLYDRAAIQYVVTQIAARLATNHMDLKRAALLLQSCQIAAANLTANDRAANAKVQAEPLAPAAQELDPTPDPEALVRYQAYRAELGLDEDEENEQEPAATTTTPPKADSRSLTADPQNPATEPQPAANTEQRSTDTEQRLTDTEQRSTETEERTTETILPTLNAAAAPNTARSAYPQRSRRFSRKPQHGTKCRPQYQISPQTPREASRTVRSTGKPIDAPL